MSRILFKKEGRAKYISHLDLMRTMQRSYLRAGLAIKHTSGFNPHPYMAFALPLSVGTESLCELMDFELVDDTQLTDIPALLNQNLPEEITVLSAYDSDTKFKDIKWLDTQCRLVYDSMESAFVAEKLRKFFSLNSIVIEKRSKKGIASVDIVPMIHQLDVSAAADAVIITARISAQEPSLSPSQLVSAIEQQLPELKPDFVGLKRIEVFNKDHMVFR
ncbi:MAG: TIGR03936 family radical SAM-associated protein [Oscillospiraceae bacterium]